jgi:shikimate kinase
MKQRNLVLIGFMGAGKSTIGRLCASRLGFRFVDTDAEITARAGQSIAQLFQEQGETAFRELERAAVEELTACSGLVIATGGGVVINPENVARLRRCGLVVLLNASPDTILKRVGSARSRPLLAGAADPRAKVEELLESRRALYEAAAHTSVSTDHRAMGEVARDVLRKFYSCRCGTGSGES